MVVSNPSKLAIHWPRFGPYHISRLETANLVLKNSGMRLVGLEIASQEALYPWDVCQAPTNFERYTVFPGQIYESMSNHELVTGIFQALNKINPEIVAINGYSTLDAWTILTWCRIRRRKPILMSDSRYDDFIRKVWKEQIKHFIVIQHSSVLCSGTLQKNYMEKLGFPRDKIFLGYSSIDNTYFLNESVRVRNHPNSYRHLPGLERVEPYFLASSRFIDRKNIPFLIRCYARYRGRMLEIGSKNKIWRLVIVGDGETRKELEQLVIDLKVDDISFAGFRQIGELPAYYGLASAFIHPASQDQWGLVVNEAMASRLPVLVSIRSGCAVDLVVNGVNGFTFDPENTEQLANLMCQFSSEYYDLESMGNASVSIIRNWGLDMFADSLYRATQAALH